MNKLYRLFSIRKLIYLYLRGADLHHFNGGQWYVGYKNIVHVFDTTTVGKVTIGKMSDDKSINYITNNGNTKDFKPSLVAWLGA